MVIFYLSTAKSKFGLPDDAQLDIFDETDTAVDEDIFLELVEAHPDLCLTVRERILGKEDTFVTKMYIVSV